MAKTQTSTPVASNKTATSSWLRRDVLWVCGAQFCLVGAYMLTTVIFDSWNLIPHEVVSQRWTIAGILLAFIAVAWFAAHSLRSKSDIYYRGILYALVLADIVFASYNVFWERGMVAKSVMLFAVPVISAAVARSRASVVTAAVLSVAAYSTACVRYFTLHYGEGYRVQLYGEVFFYSALLFILVALVAVVIRTPKQS